MSFTALPCPVGFLNVAGFESSVNADDSSLPKAARVLKAVDALPTDFSGLVSYGSAVPTVSRALLDQAMVISFPCPYPVSSRDITAVKLCRVEKQELLCVGVRTGTTWFVDARNGSLLGSIPYPDFRTDEYDAVEEAHASIASIAVCDGFNPTIKSLDDRPLAGVTHGGTIILVQQIYTR